MSFILSKIKGSLNSEEEEGGETGRGEEQRELSGRQALRLGLFTSSHHGDILCLQHFVSLASPRYEAEDRVDMRTARHRICQGTLTKTRQAQIKLCQRQEPLWP